MGPFPAKPPPHAVRLFLCGDVMTGRGLDQVMAHPSDPMLHEDYAQSALDYVRLAEDTNGPIPRNVDPAYVWGSALDVLADARPDLRIINLETSITRSEDYIPKGINYRMSPENADCLEAAAIDCCVLANNHVLDWGRAGLVETLSTLQRLQVRVSGAGVDSGQATAPAAFDIAGKGRVLIFSYASTESGAPSDWSATAEMPGINLLPEPTDESAARVCEEIARLRRPDDVIVVSIHWGLNWGHDIPESQRRFAHKLIDDADISVVHGHSSHHAKAIEIYRNRLVLYGCGDFLNDYEGIRGHEDYRDDLAVMYLADIDATSRDLVGLALVPLQIRRFRLNPPSQQDIEWLARTLDRESRKFGTGIALTPAGWLEPSWRPKTVR